MSTGFRDVENYAPYKSNVQENPCRSNRPTCSRRITFVTTITKPRMFFDRATLQYPYGSFGSTCISFLMYTAVQTPSAYVTPTVRQTNKIVESVCDDCLHPGSRGTGKSSTCAADESRRTRGLIFTKSVRKLYGVYIGRRHKTNKF